MELKKKNKKIENHIANLQVNGSHMSSICSRSAFNKLIENHKINYDPNNEI